ncbi:MAG: ABC transporter permease [Chloroflexi bacterium]|nr:ABC transporter permease [Chloroflexota bacterium]
MIRFLWSAGPPLLVFVVVVATWQAWVTAFSVPRYLVPAPTDVVSAWLENRDNLIGALISTFVSALFGFGLAIVVGMSIALLMAQSKLIERSIFPYAVLLQTIPIVAIAPLIVIWFGAGMSAVVTIAFLISLFPIVTNTTAGLLSTDHNLVAMFELYNANWWQRMVKLKLPFALPYIMTGLRISSGLAVIGAIVGEFIAGIGGMRGGIGYVITSAAAQIKMPYLFAAALTSSILGIIIFIVVSIVSARFLHHWHESAVQREH